MFLWARPSVYILRTAQYEGMSMDMGNVSLLLPCSAFLSRRKLTVKRESLGSHSFSSELIFNPSGTAITVVKNLQKPIGTLSKIIRSIV